MANEHGGCGDPNCENCKSLKLDCSAGTGDLCKVIIYTRDDVQGERADSFVFPYVLINFGLLQMFASLRQITGYKVERLQPTQEGQ